MATIKLQGNAAGSGTIILTAPNTNETRTLTLPDANSVLIGGSPVVGTLNGQGTLALQNSKGVSSATDVGTGKYQFNFSDNFSTATYYGAGVMSYATSDHWAYLSSSYTGGNQDHTRTTAQCKVGSYNTGYIDSPSVGLMASE